MAVTSELSKAWEQACGYLSERLGSTTFETWILPLRPLTNDSGGLTLEAPDAFFKDWVAKHHQQASQ